MPGMELAASSDPRLASFRRTGVLIVGAVAVLLTGGALGYSLRPEVQAGRTVHSAQWKVAQWQGPIFYGTVATMTAVLLLTLVRSLGGIRLWRFGRANRFAGRKEKPAGRFVEEAKAMRIGLRVSREGYDLLRHHYPRPMCIALGDSLRGDLKLTEANIVALRSELLGRTDRWEQTYTDVKKLETVGELLLEVEDAPRERIDRAAMRLRITDLPFPARPVVENIEFTPSTPVADPDFLRRAHFNWLRRRDSDYKGFRSRAADVQAASEHAGPFRRANEQARREAIQAEAGRIAREAAAKNGGASNSGVIFIPPRRGAKRPPHDSGLRSSYTDE